MDDISVLKGAIDDINGLIIQGVVNWKKAVDAIDRISIVIEAIEKKNKAKEEAYRASIEDAKKRREQQKNEAIERGEEIVGGETIHINADGTKEVLIP